MKERNVGEIRESNQTPTEVSKGFLKELNRRTDAFYSRHHPLISITGVAFPMILAVSIFSEYRPARIGLDLVTIVNLVGLIKSTFRKS